MSKDSEKKGTDGAKRPMANDHLTVGHLKDVLTSKPDFTSRHMTTTHLSDALDPKPQPQPVAPAAQPTVPSAPPTAASTSAEKKQ